MAKEKQSGNRNKKPKKVGKHQWNFHKFLKYLDDHQAEVKIKHTTELDGETSGVTYSPKKGDLSLRQLVFDACGFDKMSQVYRYTRSQALKDKLPRGQELRESYMDIIESVRIEFGEENQNTRSRSKVSLESPLTKYDLYLRGQPRTQWFALSGVQFSLLDVYPDIRDRIVERTAELSEVCILGDHFPFDKRTNPNRQSLIISDLIEKAFNFLSKSEVQYSEVFRRNFKEILELYEEQNIAAGNIYTNAILPDYSGFSCWFDRQELCYLESRPDRPLMPRSALRLDEIQSNYNICDFLTKPSQWFCGDRYQIMTIYKDTLLANHVQEWPEYYFEHVLLMGMEFQAVEEVLLDIVREQAKQIRLRILYSKDGGSLLVDHTNISIAEFSELLMSYNIVSGINEIINIKADQLIEGPVKRYPADVVRTNNFSSSEIEEFISHEIRKHFFERLTNFTKFYTDRLDDYFLELKPN